MESINKIINKLKNEIDEAQRYVDKFDTGELHNPSDPYETVSFQRGKSVGLIIAHDLIKNLEKDET